MKKLMLGALAALCAMLALPAFASALPAHLSENPGSFTVHGGASALSRVGGGGTNGTTTTGTGSFENTTTGTVSLVFHEVKSSIGTNCTSAGQPTGTVKTATLPFHLVMLATEKPGILLTPPAGGGNWAHYSCGIFIPTVQVTGNGILGTITSPSCGVKSNTATLSFKGTEGVQEHLTYTGTTYDLHSTLSEGGATATSAMTAEATIKFGVGKEPSIICTH
jgi:hypothetical protein